MLTILSSKWPGQWIQHFFFFFCKIFFKEQLSCFLKSKFHQPQVLPKVQLESSLAYFILRYIFFSLFLSGTNSMDHTAACWARQTFSALICPWKTQPTLGQRQVVCGHWLIKNSRYNSRLLSIYIFFQRVLHHIYLHWIFVILHFETSTLISWIFY